MDVIEQLEIVVPEFQRVVRGVRFDQLDNPTPCEGWAVRDLCYHLLAGRAFRKVVRGDDVSEEEMALYKNQSSADRPDLGIPDEDLLAEVAGGPDDTLDAFRAPGAMDRTVTIFMGEYPGDTFAHLAVFELINHTWDFARASGQEVHLPDELCLEVVAWARETMGDEWRTPKTFGPETAPPPDPTPLEQVLAYSGRKV